MRQTTRHSGLAAWEILVVLAIMMVLGVAAVSETMASRVRAKLARVRVDMARTATALEAYALDYRGAYPHIKAYADDYLVTGAPGQFDRGAIACVTNLSSPVAYLADSRVPDQFAIASGLFQGTGGPEALNAFPTLTYINVMLRFEVMRQPRPSSRKKWYLLSYGPDIRFNSGSLGNYQTGTDSSGTYEWPRYAYDPSNGTISEGDILRFPL